ncbi:unnamed protein product [Fraxinus pennsylvanica]|uniref:U3 small nucleolar RNA-associated protein 15 C-terminal domain-containing protein n=1 Tax=Fraxinus pennsylvanica TaxID=56036 RepID=A0AAD1ZZK7_9LAMI|nr:unnamed protein product [Fraxinus pennsylvanica]
MRFPNPLLSVGFSPDCSTRVIGTSNGTFYIGRRKVNLESDDTGDVVEFGAVEVEPERRVLRPTYFRYFHRGQNTKPLEGDYLIKRPRKLKFAEHDKFLKKYRHKEALVVALSGKNPENLLAVMEELVARKKLLKCVSSLDKEELRLLLGFLQKYCPMPRYAGFLMRLADKVVEMRADDIKSFDQLRGNIRNLKLLQRDELYTVSLNYSGGLYLGYMKRNPTSNIFLLPQILHISSRKAKAIHILLCRGASDFIISFVLSSELSIESSAFSKEITDVQCPVPCAACEELLNLSSEHWPSELHPIDSYKNFF